MNLFCPDCKEHTDHGIRPWQIDEGIQGAVSIFCEECSRLAIAELSKLPKLTFSELKED